MADLPAVGRTGDAMNLYKMEKSCYVYAIRSEKRKYIYVGISKNTARRISEHNNGRERTTKPYLPFETILIEKFSSREMARTREKYLKSGIGKDFLKGL